MSIFQLKQTLADPVDLHGVLYLRIGLPNHRGISTYLTRLDQALIIWGIVTAVISGVAQVYPLAWTIQAVLWSVLSCAAILITSSLTWFWVNTRQQRWILYIWSLLILIGLALTDYGIFFGWGLVLVNLCSLWLGLSALGYFATGMRMRAPALIVIAIVHIGAIPLLTVLPTWQFLLTGGVISCSLFCLAAFQWQHQ